MKYKLFYLVITILVGIVGFVGLNAVVDLPASGIETKAREGNQIVFTVKPVNQSVLLLEPIVLEFGISNPTEEEQTFKGAITLNSVRLSIRQPSGEVVMPSQLESLTGGNNVLTNRTFQILKPGEKREWVDHLEFQLDKYFGEPGEYQIMATYQNDHSIKTDWTTLVVEQPVGEDHAAYQKLIQYKKELGSVFKHAKASDRDSFVNRFPNSRYAAYVRYFSGSELIGTDNVKAKELLEEARDTVGFALSGEADKKIQAIDREEENKRKREEQNQKIKERKGQ